MMLINLSSFTPAEQQCRKCAVDFWCLSVSFTSPTLPPCVPPTLSHNGPLWTPPPNDCNGRRLQFTAIHYIPLSICVCLSIYTYLFHPRLRHTRNLCTQRHLLPCGEPFSPKAPLSGNPAPAAPSRVSPSILGVHRGALSASKSICCPLPLRSVHLSSPFTHTTIRFTSILRLCLLFNITTSRIPECALPLSHHVSTTRLQ